MSRPSRVLPWALPALLAVACGGGEDAPAPAQEPTTMSAAPARLPELLASGQAVFGIFSGDHTREQGRAMAANMETDFVFYSLEEGPFDIPAMEAYMEGLSEAAAGAPLPVLLRIPPVREGREAAADHIRQGLDAGVDGLVFPHVESADETAFAIGAMGDDVWPASATGSLINIVLIEDQAGVADARAIVGAPGVSVAIPGPGDLRRAYEGDMEAVENAIQSVLAVCLELDVACGITAGPDDIAERLRQGFRLIIVTDPAALRVGRAAAGR